MAMNLRSFTLSPILFFLIFFYISKIEEKKLLEKKANKNNFNKASCEFP